MPKNKQQAATKKLLPWLREYWWLLLLLAPLLIVIVSGIGFQVKKYQLHQRFNNVYNQILPLYKSFDDNLSPTANNGDNSIKKHCRNIGGGFVTNVECGIYIEVSQESAIGVEEIQNYIDSLLSMNHFREVMVSIGDEKSDGVAQFKSNNGMNCHAYWDMGSHQLLNISLYCRENVPGYLSGYSR